MVQVPVLFTGTMRSNLDPFERHNDMDIWAALRRAHLARVVESNPLGLEMTLAEGGAPLSAGQKQLVALARALLRNSKVCDGHFDTACSGLYQVYDRLLNDCDGCGIGVQP